MPNPAGALGRTDVVLGGVSHGVSADAKRKTMADRAITGVDRPPARQLPRDWHSNPSCDRCGSTRADCGGSQVQVNLTAALSVLDRRLLRTATRFHENQR